MKKIAVIFLTAALCMSALCGCSAKDAPMEVREVRANYAMNYGTLASLTENSEKIAVVKVLDEGVCEDKGGVCTVNQLEVLTPVSGCEGGEILSHVTPGGIVDGVQTIVNGVKQLEKGSTYLLFLDEMTSDLWICLNHDQGRFLLQDGLLTSAHYDPEHAGESLDSINTIKDAPLEDILEKVDAYLSAS